MEAFHACSVSGTANEVFCWGRNSEAQCGQPAGADIVYPTALPNGFAATALAVGNESTCAIVPGGKAMCWGTANAYGRLGSCATEKTVAPTPGPVGVNADCSKSLEGVTSIATVGDTYCAVTNGAVTCWGIHAGAYLGDGSPVFGQRYAATQAIKSGAVSITGGGAGFYAIVQNGLERDVRYWGFETYYEAGQSTAMATRPTPIGPKW
jgi:hypothetical protein